MTEFNNEKKINSQSFSLSGISDADAHDVCEALEYLVKKLLNLRIVKVEKSPQLHLIDRTPVNHAQNL